MRAKAFVPGHISCIFRPVKTGDLSTTGSMGFGIRLDLGCTATVWERDDDIIDICINGERCDAKITRAAVEAMEPGRGFEIRLKHDLPLEQGFGASASGTLAACLCVAELLGKGRQEAVAITHRMECAMGGGLGDLLAIDCSSRVPIRVRPGIPNSTGESVDSGLDLRDLTLIVSKEPLSTDSILSDPKMMEIISSEGDKALRLFMNNRTIDGLFEASNQFSKGIGLESREVSGIIQAINDRGYKAGMCMLGNSVFSTIPAEDARELFQDDLVISCGTYPGPVSVTRI